MSVKQLDNYLEVLPNRYHEEFKEYSDSRSYQKSIRWIFEEYLITIVDDLSFDESQLIGLFLYGNDVNNDITHIQLKEVLKLQKRRYIQDINRLKDTEFTIISSNCVGGVVYHNLGLEFKSPTINLFLKPKDFVKFCARLDYYIACEIIPVKDNGIKYPIGQVDDILIYGLHYDSFEELKKKWEDRKRRICWSNLFFIMTERDGCTREDILNFDNLPYPNKIVFVHKPMPDINSAFYLKGTEDIEDGEICVVPLSGFKKNENIRFIDEFDYVSFLNKGLD